MSMYLKGVENLKGVLLDIEGTTTPIDFVQKKLFSFARENLDTFLSSHREDRQVMEILHGLREIFISQGGKREDWKEPGKDGDGSASKIIKGMIDSDSKLTPLKDLESMIWELGYSDGQLKGEVFQDVPVAMKRWVKKNLIICIYSSGSIKSQQLIFSTTRFGDLSKYIFSYFDTRVGVKKDSASYDRISGMIGLEPEQICFISDSYDELVAAREAGFVTLFSERGLPSPQNSKFQSIRTFDDLPF